MNLYKIKYITNDKPKTGYILSDSYANAELLALKIQNLKLLLSISLEAGEGNFGRPNILLK